MFLYPGNNTQLILTDVQLGGKTFIPKEVFMLLLKCHREIDHLSTLLDVVY